MSRMPKRINTGNLKVKYVLGNQPTVPGYPDMEDVLFELIDDYCGRVSEEVKFTNVSLKKRFNLSDDNCEKIIKKMNELNLLEEVNSTSSYVTYKLIKNPYV